MPSATAATPNELQQSLKDTQMFRRPPSFAKPRPTGQASPPSVTDADTTRPDAQGRGYESREQQGRPAPDDPIPAPFVQPPPPLAARGPDLDARLAWVKAAEGEEDFVHRVFDR